MQGETQPHPSFIQVYRDKLCDAKDLETFDKTQKDIMKKNFDDATETDVFIDPLIYCHFAKYAGFFCSILKTFFTGELVNQSTCLSRSGKVFTRYSQSP